MTSGGAATGHAATVFVRWTWWRAALHRGWWLVTSVYLVVDAGLSASQLALIGVAQAGVGLVFEVPAGVLADLMGRTRALVVSHVLMGTAMITTGLVAGFVPLLATQMVWGLAWTFASGADVAWITDELDQPARVPLVLMRAGRAQLTGAVAGMVGVGALAWLTSRSTAMVLAGAAMLPLGGYVLVRFRERRFIAPARRWSTGWSVLARGFYLVRGSRVLLVVFTATLLVNGVAGMVGRLYPRRLVDIGLAGGSGTYLTALGVLAYLTGAGGLWLAERHTRRHAEGADPVRRGYLAACGVGGVGVVCLAGAPEPAIGGAATLLAAGALPLTRTFGTIWVNRHTTSDVRATVHSLLAQAEYLGAIGCGLAVAAVAGAAGLPVALLACGALLAVTILLVRSLAPIADTAAGPRPTRPWPEGR